MSAEATPFYLVVWLIVQRADGQMLLGRRAGTGYGAGLWGLPGGRVERGEALRDAAVRETWEEVGLRVRPEDLLPLGVSRYDLGETQGTDFFFLTRVWEGDPRPLDGTSEVGWFAPDALPPDALPWLAPVLDAHLTRGEWLSEQLGPPGPGSD